MPLICVPPTSVEESPTVSYQNGEGAVVKYGYQIPPYNETQDYVRRISGRYQAIARPIRSQKMEIEDKALALIYQQTHGYAYFLQEWGKHSWDAAKQSPIRVADVETAAVTTVAALDDSFFRVRFDRLTPLEKRYLRAMAELGPGPHRSGDVALVLHRDVTSLGPVRNKLVAKGMIWSPSHGDTGFTVPLFDEFMKRVMPREDWRD